jgi:hypothetical protein|nr:prophage MuMc02 [uncultured Mediterranean phage uvMED]|tara:strand:- start:456 stop:2213 length:1758 start_codon:yes stop_codon:yes gene_type:complete
MAGIKDYSTTQANNTSLNGISTAEGMLPSNLNNAIRALMKNTRDFYNDAQWVEYGDGSGSYTAAYVSGTAFTINGADVTSEYHAGRRIKIYLATTAAFRYGVIASSSFSTNTTVNVTWDSGSLANETLSVYLAILTKTNDSIPTGISATKIADGTISDTEFQYLNGVSSAIQTQLDAKQATITGSATTIDTESLTANRAVISNGSQKIAVSDVTDTELGYLDGVTSAVQTQIDSKQATITGGASTIASSDLTASRALQSNGSGKVEVSDVTTTELGYLDGVSSAIQTQLDAKQTSDAQLTDIAGLTPTDSNFIVGDGSNFVTESGATARTSLGLGSIATQAANNVSISGGAVTGLGSPSASSDAATKNYVDQAVAGLRTRTIAECASTANVNLSNGLEAGDSIDGVTLVAGDRVLLKDQTDATENGLYLAVSSGAASRDPEHDSIAELSGGMVVVNQGSTNDNKIFLCTTDNTGSVGSTNITYTVITPSNVGTVTSVAVADSGSSEFTVANSPITSSGTITLAVNSIANTKITGLGTASTKTVGTSANNVVQLDGSAKLPAVDGSQLTNIDAASAGFAVAMAIAL